MSEYAGFSPVIGVALAAMLIGAVGLLRLIANVVVYGKPVLANRFANFDGLLVLGVVLAACGFTVTAATFKPDAPPAVQPHHEVPKSPTDREYSRVTEHARDRMSADYALRLAAWERTRKEIPPPPTVEPVPEPNSPLPSWLWSAGLILGLAGVVLSIVRTVVCIVRIGNPDAYTKYDKR